MHKDKFGHFFGAELRYRIARLAIVFAAGFAVCIGSVGFGYGQKLMSEIKPGGTMRLDPTDLAVLERQELRNDLPCDVSPVKPELEWDFSFHAGFHAGLPMSQLVGGGNVLTILFRVVPEDQAVDPVYMFQRIQIPAVEKASKGEKSFYGMFTVGEGKYHVDWLMRDQRGRVCAAFWDLEPRLNSKDTRLREWIPKASVQPIEPLFTDDPPVEPASKSGLPHVSVIVNFDPQDPSSTQLEDRDVESLVTILRRIGRDPRVQTSIIACSLETQQIFYQEDKSPIHLPALGEALKSVKFGMVDAKRLASGNSPGDFASDLIREHIKLEKPDALIVLGRKQASGAKVSKESLDALEDSTTPSFYFSYNTARQPPLAQDPISSIIKRLRGLEYRLDRPKDLFNAWSEVILRIVQTKRDTQTSMAMKAADTPVITPGCQAKKLCTTNVFQIIIALTTQGLRWRSRG